MARIRTIKPEFPEDETLGHVCRDARLMFVLLWTICDDFGRFRASASYLRGQLFPYDEDISNKEVNEWLDQLCLVGRTKLYRVGNQAYGYVVNWTKHQRIDNASKSSIPEPLPEQELSTDKSNVCEIPRNFANLGGSPLERNRKGIGKDKEPAASAALPEWVPKEPWNGYLEMRKRIRRQLSTRGVQLILGKLEKLRASGQDPGAVLDQSTEHSWQGVFEVKNGEAKAGVSIIGDGKCSEHPNSGLTPKGRCWECLHPS
jgi:hypothetical protein